MGEALTELEVLREATRVRLSKSAVKALRDLADCYDCTGDRADRVMAAGLSLLLDMHDRLEALRNAQA